MPAGRPIEYNEQVLAKAEEYIKSCIDEDVNNGTPEKPFIKTKVNVPTKGGLAVYLDVSRDTLYDWAKKYKEFSYIMERLGSEQESRLINNGLAGTYNSTIAKVLLTKHGYREGIDGTTNDKDLPTPIFNYVTNRDNNSNPENTEAK